MLIGFWIMGVPYVSRFIDWFLNENQDLEQERKKRHRAHQKDLIDTTIIPWYEHTNLDITNEVNYPLAIEHLRSGYKNIWKLKFKECRKIERQIWEDEKPIKKFLINNFGGLPSDFGWEYTSNNMKNQILETLEDLYQKNQLPDGSLKSLDDIVEAILKDKSLPERIERINNNKILLEDKIEEYEKYLKKIAYEFDKWDVEFKGTCDECKKR